MTDKDAARAKIAALVEKYRSTPRKQRESYSEQETREFLILPLFRALGWDTENPAEFSAEEQISRGFVDFGFYLNGVVAFYLETKKTAEDIDKPQHMKQAINYSYLKGVTWAVLSDFEGVMVFNAEWEETDPVKTRFLDLHWENYADSDFERLWLLSRSSFLTREIDGVAESFGRKARKEPVTETLFKQLTVWRRELFEQMRTYGTKIWSTDPHAVDNAVQKFLDRLIFLRTVEDRGVEGGHLKEATRQAKSKDVFPALLKLFREMDTVYNSNLFADSELDYMEVHDPDLLKGIVDGLYRSPGGFVTYDFNAITADILGAVYEQYLGFKALDPEGKTALDPRKQEKRKKQGIYYTPQFVVRYIVRQTLGKMLESGVDPHQLRILDPACGSGSFLIEAFDVLDRWLAQNGTDDDKKFPRRRRMRILQENLYGVDLDDQAVEVTRLNLMLRAASERGKLPLLTHIQHGNSLIDDAAVAGETAFNWAERFPSVFAGHHRPLWFVTFVTHNSRVSERMVTYGIQGGEPFIFLPEDQILIAEKIAEACQKYQIAVVAWNVLPDHVHMVIAADDENRLNEYVRKIKGYSSYAFKRGTSAVAPDEAGAVWARKFNRQPITDTHALHQIIDYVMTNHHKHAERWGDELLQTWEVGVGSDSGLIGSDSGLKPTVAQTTVPQTRPLSQIIHTICVTPEEAAHVPGGFDVVIGNPPYVRQETLGAAFKDYAAKHYETYAGTNDLYVYFIEKEMKLLKEGGKFGIIVANKWMRANYGTTLRRWLKTQALEAIIDFGDLPVFQDATAYPCILIAGKNQDDIPAFHATQVDTLNFTDLQSYVDEHRYPVNRDSLEDSGWSLAASEAAALLVKVRAAGVPLGDYVNGEIYYGIKTGLNEAFVIDAPTRDRLINQDPRSSDLIKPFLAGRDVKRYTKPAAERYLISIPNGWTRANLESDETVGLSPLSEAMSWEWFSQSYPAIARHLQPFADAARRRTDQGEFWWELRPCAYYKEFEKPKIIYAEIAASGQFSLDAQNMFGDTTTYILASDSKYLLGILNSKIFTLLFSKSSSEIRGGFFRWKYQYIKNIPIPRINFDNPADKARHDRMVQLVEQMLNLKQQFAAESELSGKRHEITERIDYTDRHINALVYELYGLTDDEIRIVEGT